MRAAFVLAIAIAALALPATGNAAPPSNDAFVSAIPVSALPLSDSLDVSEASMEPGEPFGGCYSPGKTVWYSFQPASDLVMRADAAGSSFFATVVNVYRSTGTGLGGLSLVGCSYPWSPGNLRLSGGETYYIQAGAASWEFGGTLNVNLAEIPPPPNDDFANAAVVGSLPYSDSQTSLAATREPDEPMASCGPGTSNSHWYSFTAPASGSYTARTSSGTWPVIGVYRGGALASLNAIDCRSGGGALLTFRAEAGETTFIQIADVYAGNYGPISFSLEVAPSPVAQFWYGPGDPSQFDTLSFNGGSYDPGGNPIVEELYEFGDGTSAVGCCPQYIGGQPDATHRYAQDGDYTVRVTATTSDGRSAAQEYVVSVRTHDVAITKLGAPQSASAGQTRELTIGLRNSRYAENVTVQLYRSRVGGGWDEVGSQTQAVPPRSGNRTTSFSILYTFTAEDKAVGKVTFKAVATINGARDALPGDNEIVSPPTKVN